MTTEPPVHPARAFWQIIETIHAVTYFAPESIGAAKAAGLRGFWMGYFGFRAAPLGAVSAGVVEAAFANFAPSMVERSIPDAWRFADPADLVQQRAAAAASALRRISGEAERVSIDVDGQLRSLAARGDALARPIYSANRSVDRFDDPVQELWQLCTTLREQRGDGHLVALASHGVSGIEAHHLLAADSGVDPDVFFSNRGWSDAEREDARHDLVSRGLLDADGGLTDAGVSLRLGIESSTDDLAPVAARPVVERLALLARGVAASGVLPFPNPMGLPALGAHV